MLERRFADHAQQHPQVFTRSATSFRLQQASSDNAGRRCNSSASNGRGARLETATTRKSCREFGSPGFWESTCNLRTMRHVFGPETEHHAGTADNGFRKWREVECIVGRSLRCAPSFARRAGQRLPAYCREKSSTCNSASCAPCRNKSPRVSLAFISEAESASPNFHPQ